MILVRTCGLGTVHNDERLQLLRKMIEYRVEYCSAKIFKLHDHKGDLTVHWFSKPTQSEIGVLDRAWEFFEPSDVKHLQVIITDKPILL